MVALEKNVSLPQNIFDMKQKLPFIFGKSSDLINFTDREEESQRLEMNFKSLINTTIISPRRWGKTSLVENVAEKIRNEQKEIKVCIIDIFNVRSEADRKSVV